MDWIHRIGICHYSLWCYINPSKSPYDQLEGSISYENESKYESVQSNLMSSVPSPSLKTCISELLQEEPRCFTQASMEQKGITSNSFVAAHASQAKPRDTSKI